MKKITLFFILGIGINSYCQAPGGGMTDIDVNTYNSVIIGTQEWMSDNLKTTRYCNGDLISNITDNSQWSGLTSGGWGYNNNTSSNNTIYGKLYNWYAVADSRNVCPCGWHVPSDAEWTILTDYLGGIQVAGGKMKLTGTTLWHSPNINATNSSGFSGQPGGFRYDDGNFVFIGNSGFWWSSSENTIDSAYYRDLVYNNGEVYRFNTNKHFGFSVRCLKD